MTGIETSTATQPSRVVSPNTWPGGRALAASPLADNGLLNLDQAIGQRVATWTFDLINGVTGQRLGQLHPVYQPAMIDHDASRIIKRALRLGLTVADVTAINPLTDRVLPHMHIGGFGYPLGRFMFTDPTNLLSTGGTQGIYTLLDEMFLIDQQLDTGFAFTGGVDAAVRALLVGAPLVETIDRHPGMLVDATEYAAVGGWSAGTTRGQVLDALAMQGDYETAWMDHTGILRMVRTIDPDTAVADLDLDTGRRIIINSISITSDLLNAPNRFVVVGNGASSAGPIIGTYDVPSNAPHSITNRGFIVPTVVALQLASSVQATAVARGLGLRQTIFETADLSTPPDPRHDGHTLLRWQGANWLELAWSMTCQEGADMRHRMRRALRT